MTGEWVGEATGFSPRAGRGRYRLLFLDSPSGRRIQVCESPTGRTLHIHVGGQRWIPDPDDTKDAL